MTQPRFKAGDRVKAPDYDRSERPFNRIGAGVVEKTKRVRNCESGFMVSLRDRNGHPRTLDQNWLEHEQPTLSI